MSNIKKVTEEGRKVPLNMKEFKERVMLNQRN